jgi:4-hydroxybenzoate polyprenyltransferase
MAIWFTACILMITYELGPSTKSQGLKGNISISVMVGLVILYGASALSALNNSPLIFAAAATAAFANLAREILKDCQDIEGDTGRKTFPMQVGLEKARMTAYSLALAAMVFAALPYYLGWGGFGLELLIIQIPAILLLVSLNNPISKGEDRKAQKQVRIAMLAGLIGFAISVLLT